MVKPPLDRFGGIRIVQRRIKKSEIIEHNKENVAQELIDIAKANIDDIMSWDEDGKVTIKDPSKISKAAIKSIKKIKVTPTKMGPQLEVELHDKVGVLRMKRAMTHQEKETIQVSMLRNRISDKEAARIAVRPVAEWKNLALGNKTEDESRIERIVERFKNYK